MPTLIKLKCLIVDDDQRKTDRIRQLIELEVGQDSVVVMATSNAHDATAQLRNEYFDLVLVDLNLPLRPGDGPVSDGGVRLLRQVARGTANIQTPLFIMGITGFSDLADTARDDFCQHAWALVTYTPESTKWEDAVVNQCRHIIECKDRMKANAQQSDCDVAFVTALSDVELEAVKDLPLGWKSFVVPGDSCRYLQGTISSRGQNMSAIACSAPEMGNPAAAMTTVRLLQRFRPKVCLLVGVCAGIDAQIGDLVAGEFSLHYESGKWTQGDGGQAVFQPAPRYQPASTKLLEALRRYKMERSREILALPADWRADRPKAPELVIGPVASGAAVIENAEIVRNLQFRDRKLCAIEMESYGFYLSIRNSAPYTEYVMIKGVCDNASPPKTDQFKTYAAFLSAKMSLDFILHEHSVDGGLFSG